MTVHHVIEGREKVPQRLHEIGLSVVLVETGRGGGKEIHWQMITKLLFVLFLETGTPAAGGMALPLKSLSSWQNRQERVIDSKRTGSEPRASLTLPARGAVKTRQHCGPKLMSDTKI